MPRVTFCEVCASGHLKATCELRAPPELLTKQALHHIPLDSFPVPSKLHKLAVSLNYKIPGPSAGAARAILGGWQLAGVLIRQSGTPYTVVCTRGFTPVRNAAGVIAVELIAAAQGIDFHAPLKTSSNLQKVHSKVREISPHFAADRYWADDMAALQDSVLAGEIGAGEEFLG